MAASKKKKRTAKKAPARKVLTKAKSKMIKTPGKTPAKKAPAKPAPAKKAPAKKAPAKKVSAKTTKPKTTSARSPAGKVASVVARVKDTVKSTIARVTNAVSPDYASVLKPLDDRILVSADAPAGKTTTGLFIPDSASERPTRGKVLAIGNGRRNKKGQIRPLAVEVGEYVMFAEGAGTKVTLGGTELLILREDEVLGTVD